jgi:dephospho-CoA kinase
VKSVFAGRVEAVVLDAPLLFESNLHWLCDFSLVVTCSDEARQLQRCVLRDGLTLDQARSRLQRQVPAREP